MDKLPLFIEHKFCYNECMVQIENWIGKVLPHNNKTGGVERLLTVIREVSAADRRGEDDICEELIGDLLAKREATRVLKGCWDTLSLREQQVAGLTCLGKTNRQISARLVISEDTVKTHIRNVTLKFGLHSKSELRAALSGWDFSDWV